MLVDSINGGKGLVIGYLRNRKELYQISLLTIHPNIGEQHG